jgi:uncharacterized protein with WD repeat
MSAKFSPDGRYIVTAAVDGTVRLWDAETYEQLQSEIINPREGSESPWGVTLATFSPDSTLLAAVTDSGPVPAGLVKVWEIATGDVLLEEVGGTRLFGVDFSPDGRYLAVSGPTDVPIQMWDIESGEQLLNIPPPDGIVRGIYFTEDGRQLITPAGSALHFWDAANGDLLRTLNIPQPFVLSPDGSRLFAGGEDGLVRVYLMNVDELATLARSRLTRSLTEAECQQYLHVAVCPLRQ